MSSYEESEMAKDRQEQDFYLAVWARVIIGILSLTVLISGSVLIAKAMDIFAAMRGVVHYP